METNPRSNNPIEWAPPPPVAGPGQVVPQSPQGGVESSEREEFETTLSTLVDQFTSLPPPAYGEPPEMVSTAGRTKSAPVDNRKARGRRIVGWTATACLVLVGGVGLGAHLGLNAQAPAAHHDAVAPAGEPVITVKSTPLDETPPHVQPLSDEAAGRAETAAGGQPVAVPLEEEKSAALATADPAKAADAQRPKPRHQQVRRAVTKQQPKAKPTASDWENPYD